jgi:hypothetical protein
MTVCQGNGPAARPQWLSRSRHSISPEKFRKTQWPDSRQPLRWLFLHSPLLTWHSDTFLGHLGVFTAVHLGSKGSWSRAGIEISSRLTFWPTQLPVQWEPAAVIQSHWPELESDSHFHVASKFIPFVTVFPSPSYVFMAWILIEDREALLIMLYFFIRSYK